jgi:glycosyltransferase involved in cell wall biosynthesis
MISPGPSNVPPRLLMLSTAANTGGMERVICVLARGFVSRGWSVRTVFPETAGVDGVLAWCAEQEVEAEATPHLLDLAAPHHVRHMRALGAFVRNAKPDVVLLHFGDSFMSLHDVLAVSLLGRARCLAVLHHAHPVRGRKRLMTRVASRIAVGTIGVSRATCTRLREIGVDAAALHWVPNGVRRPDRLPGRDAARETLGISRDAFLVACAARLVPQKRLDLLIDAMAALPPSGPTAVLAIAGDGPLRADLELRAKGMTSVRLLGPLSPNRIDDLYAAADVLALPSFEGFGLVYLEAAFHGVPGIGLDTGGSLDAIIPGETGLLVPPDDPQALAAALQRLRADPALAHRLGDRARDRVVSEFSDETMVDRYERLISRLVA